MPTKKPRLTAKKLKAFKDQIKKGEKTEEQISSEWNTQPGVINISAEDLKKRLAETGGKAASPTTAKKKKIKAEIADIDSKIRTLNEKKNKLLRDFGELSLES